MKVNNETSISNGNVNASRESVNNSVSKYKMLGNSKRIFWNSKRSYRSI
jgi:hypothetical protein